MERLKRLWARLEFDAEFAGLWFFGLGLALDAEERQEFTVCLGWFIFAVRWV